MMDEKDGAFVLMPLRPTDDMLWVLMGIHPKAAKKGALETAHSQYKALLAARPK